MEQNKTLTASRNIVVNLSEKIKWNVHMKTMKKINAIFDD